MENQIILTKDSGSEELKAYFTAILRLSESNNEFPVNLDDVWMLAYKRKDPAVRALRQNFIEGEDFCSLHQNVERKGGGQNEVTYYLTPSCLEYFIARKIRPVFEVYRQVFHKTAKTAQVAKLPTAKELALMVVKAEEEKEQLMIENKEQAIKLDFQEKQLQVQEKEIQRSAPKVDYYDKVMMSNDTMTTTQVAKAVGLDARKLHLKLKGLGVMFYQSGQWLMKAPYDRCRMHAIRTYQYSKSDGTIGTNTATVWNNKGLQFVITLNENDWNLKKTIKIMQQIYNTATI